MIVVNYAVKPSHGRLTVQKIHQRKMTSTIEIYFVGGKALDNEKVAGIGKAINRKELHILVGEKQ